MNRSIFVYDGKEYVFYDGKMWGIARNPYGPVLYLNETNIYETEALVSYAERIIETLSKNGSFFWQLSSFLALHYSHLGPHD
jgi:hypothetical protein